MFFFFILSACNKIRERLGHFQCVRTWTNKKWRLSCMLQRKGMVFLNGPPYNNNNNKNKKYVLRIFIYFLHNCTV